MKQSNTLKNGLSPNWLSNVWNTIEDMPINVWRKIIETGDLTILYRVEPERITQLEYQRLEKTWLFCLQEHQNEFGIPDEIRRKTTIQKRLIKLNCDYIDTRDRSLLNWIEMAEKELEQFQGTEGVKFYELLDIVSTKKGFRIDPNIFTVIEWFHALNNIKNGRDKQE